MISTGWNGDSLFCKMKKDKSLGIAGDSVSLQCVLQSDPAATYTWDSDSQHFQGGWLVFSRASTKFHIHLPWGQRPFSIVS